MTIDEAIALAEWRRDNPLQPWDTVKNLKEFFSLCADALRESELAEKTEKAMTANRYQRLAMRTATHKCYDLANAALGLTGEAGEVADIVKKHLYQGHDLYPSKVVEELGDVLWYVALMADIFNVPLEYVMENNIHKLKVRYPEGFDPVRSVNREEKHGQWRLHPHRSSGICYTC